MRLLLGIDTGGTYTDAVAVAEGTASVVATAKAPTTHHDLTLGIEAALRALLAEPGVAADRVGLVSLSTTLATNALVEAHGDPACLIAVGFGEAELERILGAPLGPVDPSGSPVRALGKHGPDLLLSIPGGHDAMGNELGPLDPASLTDAVAAVANRVSAYAVAAQFSVRNASHELAVREAVHVATGKPVTCSHELSARLDGPRRARTALLNARLIAMIDRLQTAVGLALSSAGVHAPVMMVRGDGSLASAGFAAKRPIETVLSGPAASVIGARHLARIVEGNGLVVDIGGTTTDVTVLRDGEPALAADGAVIAGHRTMVQAVDLRTHGLGGDSEVRIELRPPTVPSGAAGGSPLDIVRLGPGRALPLCRLAIDVPDVCEVLARQLAEADAVSGHGRLLVATGVEPSAGLDDRERQVLAAIAAGPRAEADAAPSSLLRLAAGRLRRRGLIRVATMTPTDAACLLGRLPGVANDVEAAKLGAELLARQRTDQGRRIAPDALALAVLIDELLVARSADALLETALDVDGLAAPDPPGGDGATRTGPVASALVRAALAGHREALSLQLAVTDPIVAVGASAGAYYPRVAEILGTEPIVPPHAEVANAVGAVVGRVGVRRQLTISRPRAGRFQLHTGDQPVFASVEAARAEGERRLGEEVSALAAEAGADQAEVAIEWSDRTAVVNGKEILVEATIVATASGRPRLG